MFENWDSFYLLVGSAAGALIGLLFVVASLTVNIDRIRAERGNRLFLSPTVFHLAVVFAVSAVTMAPGISVPQVGALIGVIALIAVIYAVRILLGLMQPGASQHWSDAWFYGAAPLACQATLGLLAFLASRNQSDAPELLAALLVIVVLLCVRNAWDLVTWIATREQPSG